MVQNRSKLARERAGLTIGQAARILNMPSGDLLGIEERDSDFADANHDRLADIYGVNIPWLKGEVPLRDYDAMKDARGYDELSNHDRDVIAEFAAAMTRKPAKTLAEISAALPRKK